MSWESEVAEEKRGRPSGPTSREESFSSAARRRRRSCSSKKMSAAGLGVEVGVGFGGLEE